MAFLFTQQSTIYTSEDLKPHPVGGKSPPPNRGGSNCRTATPFVSACSKSVTGNLIEALSLTAVRIGHLQWCI